jgi:hypothetical protein
MWAPAQKGHDKDPPQGLGQPFGMTAQRQASELELWLFALLHAALIGSPLLMQTAPFQAALLD